MGGAIKRKSIEGMLRRWKRATKKKKREKVIVKSPGRTPVKRRSRR